MRLVERWEWFEHHILHPAKSTTILLGAVVELWDMGAEFAHWLIRHMF